MPEPVAARKRALLKKLTWEEFFAKHGERNAKPYEFRDTYRENAIVFHPKFGKGYVSEVVSESKVEITFSDARRILVHNRKDIPGSPVGREDDGLPSMTAPAKPGGKGAGKAVEKPSAKPAGAPKAVPAPKVPEKKLDEKKEQEEKKVPEKKTTAKKPAAKKPATEKAAAVKKPVAKKPAKKPAAKKPVKKPAAKKPAKKKSK
jgi:cell division protein FtsN